METKIQSAVFRDFKLAADTIQNPEMKKTISVCYRNYTGMRQLLYKPVKQVYIRGFRKIKEINPSGGVNNTLVFLECE